MPNNKNILNFPKGFLWGAATSAYQIEGDNINDWSEWEKSDRRVKDLEKQGKNPKDFISGKASNSWEMLNADLECIKKINSNAYRFSIEWSRIEPADGNFDEKAIAKYINFAKKLRAEGIEPCITLWHWPMPLWARDMGSWENKIMIEKFSRLTEKIVSAFGDGVKFYFTLNEPIIYTAHSYMAGVWPPQKKNPLAYFKVLNNLAKAHKSAYKIIKKINPDAQVGSTEFNTYIYTNNNWLLNFFLKKPYQYFYNFYFLDKIKNYLDFIALDYYQWKPINFFSKSKNPKLPKNDMGWDIFPEGIYHVVLEAQKRYHKPIYIAENGLADTNDSLRPAFIKDHLMWLHKAIEDGADVRGYFHWSLLDNLEWPHGFAPQFGLYKVDRTTFERLPRPSAKLYADICQNNGIIK